MLSVQVIGDSSRQALSRYRAFAVVCSVLAPLGILCCTLLLWRALLTQERAQIRHTVDAAAQSLGHQIAERVHNDTDALSQMAARWALAGKPPRAYWEADAANYVGASPDYQAVEWIDPELHVRWVVPLKGNEAALKLNLVFEKRRATALLTARNQRIITVSRPIHLVQGGIGFLIYVPIFHRDRFEGLIAGVVRIDRLLAALPRDITPAYDLEIEEGGQSVWRQGAWDRKHEIAYQRNAHIDLQDDFWTLKAIPHADTMTRYHSALPSVVLGTGAITALLVGGLIFSWCRLRTTQERITAEVAQRIESEAALQLSEEQLRMQAAALASSNAELEAANQLLTALVTKDGLTGLNNHRAFREALTQEFERTQRYKAPLSLILLDVDKFKTYNDTFGHPEGDQVLKAVANVLLQSAREADCVCRYGGEEFVVILPHTDQERAIHAAERLRAAIEAYPWPLRSVTASVGVSTIQADLTPMQEAIDQADRALYASKQGGRNRVTHACTLTGMDDSFPLTGDSSSPYSDLLHRMLLQETETLDSSSARLQEFLSQTYDSTIQSWMRLLDMRDKESEGHGERVTELTVRLAMKIGMNGEEILYARWGAMLHDVGKMGVPDPILQKPGALTEEEWSIMKRHPVIAYELISQIPFLRPALDIPYCHHEKWDGTGYPRGLKGNDIPLAARLFAVIDVYEALTSDRPYRQAWSQSKTLAYLKSQAGAHFDPRAVKAFLEVLNESAESTLTPGVSLGRAA
jgi:diguanylate cyclase (GGDEF)-like protein